MVQIERDTFGPCALKGLFLFLMLYLFLITSQAMCHTEPLYLCQRVPFEKQLGTLNNRIILFRSALFTMGTPTGRAVIGGATCMVHFGGLVALPAQRGDAVRSEKFTCYGNEWQLNLFPGGKADSDEGIVSVYIQNMSNKSKHVEYGFHVKD